MNQDAVIATKQHAAKCPKLYGENCQCDSYHTFDELYEHRIALYIALCRTTHHRVWRSKLHSDGSSIPDWFVLGIDKAMGNQITYHLPNSKWGEVEFAATLDKAPEWDGHSSDDVLARLKLINS